MAPIVIDLLPDVAPQHVAQITALANEGAYDNVVFHRVIDGFMAQTGDVQYGKAGGDLSMAGMGGSDLPDIPAEFSDDAASSAASSAWPASQDPNSANSQFFIMFAPGDFLDGQYTVVGHVVSGHGGGRRDPARRAARHPRRDDQSHRSGVTQKAGRWPRSLA